MLTHAQSERVLRDLRGLVQSAKFDQAGRRARDLRAAAVPYFRIVDGDAAASLERQSKCLLRQKFDIETTLADIEIRRATHLTGVPTMWMALCNTPGIEKRDLSSLALLLVRRRAALPVEIAERWQAIDRQSPARRHRHDRNVARRRRRSRSTAPASRLLGVPLPGVVIEIVALDDPRRVLPLGETGEIRIKGPNVVSRILEPAAGDRRESSSTASGSPATSDTWTRTVFCSWSTARRT